MTAPSRSALFSFSATKTMPWRPDFLHCASRWRAIMPSGDAEEIAVRLGVFRFFARLSVRLLLERPTLILLLVRNLLSRWQGLSIRPARMLAALSRPLAYATFAADARLRNYRLFERRPQRQVLRVPTTGSERTRVLRRCRTFPPRFVPTNQNRYDAPWGTRSGGRLA